MNRVEFYIIFCLLLFSCNHEEISDASSTNPLILNVVDTLTVGQDLVLKFDEKFMPNKPNVIHIRNAYAQTFLEAEHFIQNNQLTLPGKFTQKKGMLEITFYKNSAKLQTQQIYLKEKEVDHIQNFFGQKFIPIDVPTQPEIISLLLDSYDNTTTAESDLLYTFIENNERHTAALSHVKNYAVMPVNRSAQVGRTIASVQYQGIYSEEEHYYTFAGFPTSFELSAKRVHSLADGSTLFEIQTSTLKDAYQNIVSEGTLVQFFIDNGREILQYSCPTLNGVAKLKLLHPSSPCTYTIRAESLPKAQSNQLSLNFISAIEDIPFHWQNETLQVGPIHTKNHHLIPHGTELKIQIFDSNGNSILSQIGRSDKGVITFTIPNNKIPKDAKISLELLGYTTPLKPLFP